MPSDGGPNLFEATVAHQPTIGRFDGRDGSSLRVQCYHPDPGAIPAE